MRNSGKPVRKCHSCPLNLGDHCWFYAQPRAQWRAGKTCRARDDAAIRREFEAWQKQPHVKTRAEIRREMFGARSRKKFYPRRENRRRIAGG